MGDRPDVCLLGSGGVLMSNRETRMRTFAALSALLALAAAAGCVRPEPVHTATAGYTYVAQSTITVSARQASRCAARTLRRLQAETDREFSSSSIPTSSQTGPSAYGRGSVSNHYSSSVEDVDGRLTLRVYAISSVFPAAGGGDNGSNAARVTPTAEARARADRVVATCARQGSRSA